MAVQISEQVPEVSVAHKHLHNAPVRIATRVCSCVPVKPLVGLHDTDEGCSVYVRAQITCNFFNLSRTRGAIRDLS